MLVADVEQRADVRMRELRDDAGFALEALARVGAGRDLRVEDFDGDDALETRVAGPVDLAHTSTANRRDDLVRAEARAGGKAHGRDCMLRFQIADIADFRLTNRRR